MSTGYKYLRASCIAIFALLSQTAVASPAHLVRDINTVGAGISSNPNAFSNQGNWSLFFADDGAHGQQPWATDGTAAGTFMWGQVCQLCPGNPLQAATRTFLFPSYSSSDNSLWVSDGTPSGTHLVGDATGDPAWITPDPIVALGSNAIFTAFNSSMAGRELWLSDGTHPSVHLKSSSGVPYNTNGAVVANNHIYFLSLNADGTYEPWISDGTSAGTSSLASIPQAAPDPNRLVGPQLVQVGNSLIFIAYTSTSGRELWRIDLATNAVSQVTDIAPGAGSGVSPDYHMSTLGAAAVFLGATDGASYALWRTDGTAGGTYPIASVRPDPSYTDPYLYIRAPGSPRALFGVASSGGEQIWATDGTVQGTVRLPVSALPNEVYPVGSSYYLTGYDATGGAHLYRTNGTAAGTIGLTTIPASAGGRTSLFVGDDTKVFVASDDANSLTGSLYVYDPKAGTAKQIARYAYATPSTIYGHVFAFAQGVLYFDNDDPGTGDEMWTSDGTSAGTQILKDIAPETQTRASNPVNFAAYGDVLYFSADDGVHGRELWRSDGTAAGTQLFADLNPGAGDSNPTNLFVANGNLYFYAMDASGSFKFWQSDGTGAGTKVLAGVAPAALPICPAPPGVVVNGVTFFAGYDSALGIQLWRTDGSAAGTYRVSNIVAVGGPSRGLCSLIAINGRIYFDAGDTDPMNNDLWVSDGTAAGTVSLTSNNLDPSFFTPYGQALYFVGTSFGQLWRTDGTARGTVQVSPINAARMLGVYSVVGGKMIARIASTAVAQFWATDGTTAGSSQIGPDMGSVTDAFANNQVAYLAGQLPNGSTPSGEVLASDGTATGTRRIYAFGANEFFVPRSFADFRGQTMFQTATSGVATWRRTDGTAAGTQGNTQAFPTGPAWGAAGQNFFYIGNDGVTGNELWVISNDPPVAVADNLGSVVSGQSITANILTNDYDPDGSLDPKSLKVLTQPTDGTVTVGTGGEVTYTARSGFTGTDSFSYSVADMQGLASQPASVKVTVTTANTTGGVSGGKSGGGMLGFCELGLLLLATCARLFRSTNAAHPGG